MIVIHTTMDRESVVELAAVASRGSGEASITVESGTTPAGMPDCMYGWGEAHDSKFCVPHTIATVEGPDEANIAREIAERLFWDEDEDLDLLHEVVVTNGEDWSNVDGHFPIRYYALHTH